MGEATVGHASPEGVGAAGRRGASSPACLDVVGTRTYCLIHGSEVVSSFTRS